MLLISFITYAQTPISHLIYANDYNIFDPDELYVNTFDTIYFENLINHNAIEIDEETFNNNGTSSNGGFELNSDGFIILEDPGTYYYICTPHAMMGMKGKIIVNENNFIGQWYADDGNYLEITSDSLMVYNFENIDCYDLEQYQIEFTLSGFNVFNDDEIINVDVFNNSDSTFSFISDDDTINMTSANFNIDAWVECNDSIDCIDDNETIISIFGEFFVNDCSSLMDYLSVNYNYSLEESCNWNGGGVFELDSNLIMDLCECTCQDSTEVITWKCFAGSCYELNDDSGEFNSLEDCELSCTSNDTTWKCSEGACVEVFDISGEFSSIEECQANCNASIINEHKIGINIFPNPSSNIFNLEFISECEFEISVTNTLGKEVYFETIKEVGNSYTQIDLSNYSKGIYSLTIRTLNGISNHKLILQ